MSEKPCVVYIEDDTPSRVLVQVLLQQDYDIHTAANGLEGLNLVRRHQPDIVITDLNLPDLHGEMIAARIRTSAQKDIPIIALTSDSSREAKNRAIAAGCTGFLTKPIDGLNFSATIREYLHGRVDAISDNDRRRATGTVQAHLAQKLEDTLRQVQDDNAMLRTLDRAKNSFLTQVSHEMRTPLTVLSGYVQMLNAMMTPGGAIDESYTIMGKKLADSTKRLQTLINEFVIMARVASDQFELKFAPMRLSEPFADVKREYEDALQARRLSFETSGEGWEVAFMGDLALLRVVFSNLVSNAIKATPDGGRITINAAREAGNIHLTFRDTGVGIAANELTLLFQPFYTAIDVSRGKTSKTDFQGMGLGMGLTISTRIVEGHKGHVWAESPGHDPRGCPGSTFHVLIPVALTSPP
ncbi:MAG TPA: hybrid sensor histidine kinase/response regulator [Aggregatilineales bacterium]|nr:hybrid sensor histidine kinase/response regulator [Anaerolineales bacterium]HRE49096.1 hybrid sensor histidine kinase/response regulator [Aggregatilineales bacterium]